MRDGKYVVLCVDDDPDLIHSLRMVLEGNGFSVVDAATAEEGVRKYRAAGPDVVIVDLMMEEIDAGTNFVREIRSGGGTIPIFMLSSVGDQLHQAADYAALGLSGILQKPISPGSLVATLRARLAAAPKGA